MLPFPVSLHGMHIATLGMAGWECASLQLARCVFGKEHEFSSLIAKANAQENWRLSVMLGRRRSRWEGIVLATGFNMSRPLS